MLIVFPAGNTTFSATRHASWAPNTSKMRLRQSAGLKRIFDVFSAQGMCLVAENVVLFPLNEIYKLKQMWLFLNVLYVTMLSRKFYMIIIFISGGVLTLKTVTTVVLAHITGS